MEIEELITRATVKETADITENVSTAVEKSAIADEYMNTVTSGLKSLSELMLKGIGYQQSKALKDQLKDADETRDNLMTTLNYFIKAYLQWNKPETIDAAHTISNIIETQGPGIAWLSYEKESASLNAMLNQFELPVAKAALDTLNQTPLVNELIAAQNNFKLQYQQSAETESTKEEIIAPSKIKPDAIDKLNKLINYLNVMNQAHPEVYGNVAALIAELVNTLNGKIRNRY